MSFFKPPAAQPPSQPSSGYSPPARTRTRGDRTLGVRVDEPEVPEHRRPGVTRSKRGEVGLTINTVVERSPRGCLFKVAGGWFDLDGYYCRPLADRAVEVRRGGSRKVMALLTKAQRKDLERARLNARRRGVR